MPKVTVNISDKELAAIDYAAFTVSRAHNKRVGRDFVIGGLARIYLPDVPAGLSRKDLESALKAKADYADDD